MPGVALWANLFAAWRHTEWLRERAAAPAADSPSAAELEEAGRAADDYEEECEWRDYEEQVRRGHLEAMRSGSAFAATEAATQGLAGLGGGGGGAARAGAGA